MRHVQLNRTVSPVVGRTQILARRPNPLRHTSPAAAYHYGRLRVQDDDYVPSSKPNFNAEDIAVVGGGISGLATAYNLSNSIPNAKITLFESAPRLGGWIASERHKVDDGDVLFEWGPRNLRAEPGALATNVLVEELGLTDSLVTTHRRSDAALNRFLYYPDHLVRMPRPPPSMSLFHILPTIFQTISSFLREPVFSGALSSLLAETAVSPRQASLQDESVGDFLRRRFGKPITDNIASAVFHGIYAGDIYKLSARTLLPGAWRMEKRDPEGGSVLAEFAELAFRRQSLLQGHKLETLRYLEGMAKAKGERVISQRMAAIMSATSVFTFQNGLGQLAEALGKRLLESANVTIKLGCPVSSFNYDPPTKKITLADVPGSRHEDVKNLPFDYVVHTGHPVVISTSLQGGKVPVQSTAHATTLTNLKAPSVMVVNLYYSNPHLLPPQYNGFGYLIPRSIPVHQNPERALGVIFSSATSGPKLQGHKVDLSQHMAVDTPDVHSSFFCSQDTAPGTKLTVMLGGHWWSEWSNSDMPSEEAAIAMAQTLLERHLGIKTSPTLAMARLAKDAIPQYQVGYRGHMATLHQALVNKFEGRLKVAGPWYQGGVGVNDCTRRAKDVSVWIREGWDEVTGLQGYVGEEEWWLADHTKGTVERDSREQD